MSFIVFCVLAALISSFVCDDSFHCSSWLEIEKKLKSHNLQVNCTQNATCTGMSCVFQEFGQEIHSSVHVNNCESPPSIEFSIDAPNLKINDWKRKFHHGEVFSVTDNYGGEFKLQKVNNTFVFGLSLAVHMAKNQMPSILQFFHSLKQDSKIDIQYPLFQNISVSIPPCSDVMNSNESHVLENISQTTLSSTKIPMMLSKLNILSNCTIANNSCPENELCQQLNATTSAGNCVCVPDFVRDKSGKCIYNPTVLPVTVVPGNHSGSHHSESSNTSLLLTAILVPITVIILIVGIVYATIRFRICQKMRRRLRVQVYEHVLLGEDDEADDETLNPVV